MMFYLTFLIPATMLVLAYRHYKSFTAKIGSGKVVEIVSARKNYQIYLGLGCFFALALILIKLSQLPPVFQAP
ncbi:hypothetical protein LJ707_10115 [Mucilaginibacter sp. UR6-1]|uniref:hypothetical protein n=1 Tax=Mucilaginibacter sp. UR6-1 TaxID=1435643 RepID=UPI001E4DF046|nr:hypothetical protein [Mucilaginibacter sp. UR6-1]MCC8409288.1 hypothetical protein [Mucilaginibacter sp. UR6-1]